MFEFFPEPIIILQEPLSQEKKEGSKVEFVFKCKAQDVNSKLIYQWFKDGTELPEKNEATLQLKSVTLSDFGSYKCHVSCKDSPSDVVESCPAELDVTPRDGASEYPSACAEALNKATIYEAKISLKGARS